MNPQQPKLSAQMYIRTQSSLQEKTMLQATAVAYGKCHQENVRRNAMWTFDRRKMWVITYDGPDAAAKTPLLKLRKSIYENATNRIHACPPLIQGPNQLDKLIYEGNYFRISFHDHIYGKSEYKADCPGDRWESMIDGLNLEYKPWRTKGDHIVFYLTFREDTWNESKSFYSDSLKMIKALRDETDRHIVVVPSKRTTLKRQRHFGFNKFEEKIEEMENVSVCYVEADVLDDAWCTVSINEPYRTVNSIINGVPSLTYSPHGLGTILFGSRSINDLAVDSLPCPIQFLSNLSYTQWTYKESMTGAPFEFFMGTRR